MRSAIRVGFAVGLVAMVPVFAVALLTWNDAISPPSALGLPDPGILTRWGLPVSRGLRDVSATVTIGVLVLAAVAMPADARTGAGLAGRAQTRMLNAAAVSGALWFWASAAVLVLTYSDLVGIGPFSAGGMAQLGYFVTDFDLGRSLLVSGSLAGAVAVGSLFARRTTTLGILALAALAGLWPLALTGHAAGAVNHDIAVNAQAAHLIGVTVWAGGLAALILARRELGDRFPAVTSRYSTLAGWCFGLVAVSGIVAAVLRVNSWPGLASDYGALLVVKVSALTLLGAAGWYQRRRILPAIANPVIAGRAFGALATVELTVMAAAMGTAVALSRTPPPSEVGEASTAAESLLGYPLPPTLGAAQWFSQWRIDTFWTPLAILGIGAYLFAVVRLHRRGHRWSLGRTLSWIVGSLMLIWVTSGAPGVYGEVLFSMHMVQHMTIVSAVPTFLVLGAPVTLALRALPSRKDGSRGIREWLLLVVHSKPLRLLSQPLVAAGLFIGSLVVFYYSPLFELSLRSHTAHVLMILHFLLAGYLFASVICGIDPGPRRPPYPFRMLLLMVTFGFHAFFSVTLMASSTILAKDWFSALGRTWGNTLERDQYIGASLGWALGDYPLAILAVGLIWQWVRADHREGKRYDRQADRDSDQHLKQYNDNLRRLAEHRHTTGSYRNPAQKL